MKGTLCFGFIFVKISKNSIGSQSMSIFKSCIEPSCIFVTLLRRLHVMNVII